MPYPIAICQVQYRAVMGSRETLLAYLGTLAPGDLLSSSATFGRGGSIRNLLVHTANTYQSWVLQRGLGRDVAFTPYESVTSIDEVARVFAPIDEAVFTFLADGLDPDDTFPIDRPEGPRNVTRLELFTHVITHEFHHKGQILSLSRALGYTPIDTDIIR